METPVELFEASASMPKDTDEAARIASVQATEPEDLNDLPASNDFPLDVLRLICDFLPTSALANTRLSNRSLLAASAHLVKRFDLRIGNLLCVYPGSCGDAHTVYPALSDLSFTLLDTVSWTQCGSLCNTSIGVQSVFDLDMSVLDLNTVEVCDKIATTSACAMLRSLNPVHPFLSSLRLEASLSNLKHMTAALRLKGMSFCKLSHIVLTSYFTEKTQALRAQLTISAAVLQDLSFLPSLQSLQLDLHCENAAISLHLPGLTNLSLSNAMPFNDSKGRSFTDALTLPHLQSLTWSTSMTAAAEFSAGCCSLTSLDLSACSNSDTNPMRVSYALCPLKQLRCLLLPSGIGSTRSWDPAIATLLAALPHLHTLAAPGFTFRTDFLGLLVPHQLTQLTQLSCTDIQLGAGYDENTDDTSVFLLSHTLPALRVLKLQPSEFTVSFSELAPEVTSLHLCDNFTTMTEQWDLFAQDDTEDAWALPHLHSLTMCNIDLANSDCQAACAGVKRLKLWVTPYDSLAEVVDAAALTVASMTHLEHVELVIADISETPKTDEDKAVRCDQVLHQLLSSLPEGVSHLSLTGLEALSSGLCIALAGISKLTSLSLGNIPNILMEDMFELVDSVKGLRQLRVVACEGFGLPECQHLERRHGEHDFRVEFKEHDLTRWDSV